MKPISRIKKVYVNFPDKALDLIKELKTPDETDAEAMQRIILAYLAEKGYMRKKN